MPDKRHPGFALALIVLEFLVFTLRTVVVNANVCDYGFYG